MIAAPLPEPAPDVSAGVKIEGEAYPSALLERFQASHEGGVNQTGSSESPRLLLVAPQPFYEDRGTPIAVRQVLEALGRLGYAVDLLTYPIGETPDLPAVRYLRGPNPLGLRNVPIGLSLRKLLLDALLMPELWQRMHSGEYFAVHAVEEAAFPAVLLGKKLGIPVVYDMQSSLPEQLGSRRLAHTPPVRRALVAAERWLLRNATVVMSSAGLAQRVHALAPGIDTREWWFHSEPGSLPEEKVTDLRQELQIAPNSPIVLYTGSFADYQGMPELLGCIPEVLIRFSGAVFVLVGAENDTRGKILQRATRLGVNDAIRLVDRQPRERMERYLCLANVLVSPRSRHSNNLPLKTLDYLAAGRPIVATDIPAHRAVLNGERAVLTPPTASGLASGITALLDDPTRAASLAANAQRFADENLTRAAFDRTLEVIYRRLRADETS